MSSKAATALASLGRSSYPISALLMQAVWVLAEPTVKQA